MLNSKILKKNFTELDSSEKSMTIQGTILKTCFLGLFTALTFCYNWYLILQGFTDKALSLATFGMFGGIVLVLAICFMPKNKFLILTTPLYAMCEGLVLGAISAMVNARYPGIASQAAIGTLIAFFSMFILYSLRLIQATDKFKAIVLNSTIAIFGIYLVQWILGFFGMAIPQLFSNSNIGIGFSLFVIIIASLNLIVDFANIKSFENKVSCHYEWYFGFSLLVTIIWMYIEILNLLMKLQSRD